MKDYEYLDSVRKANPRLFKQHNALIQLSTAVLQDHLRMAFNAGFKAGLKADKSLFEKMFGR